MPGIYFAAVLANLLAVAGFGTLIYKLAEACEWLAAAGGGAGVCRCSRWLSTWCGCRWITG